MQEGCRSETLNGGALYSEKPRSSDQQPESSGLGSRSTRLALWLSFRSSHSERSEAMPNELKSRMNTVKRTRTKSERSDCINRAAEWWLAGAKQTSYSACSRSWNRSFLMTQTMWGGKLARVVHSSFCCSGTRSIRREKRISVSD